MVPTPLSPEAPFLLNAVLLARASLAAYGQPRTAVGGDGITFGEIDLFTDEQTQTYALAMRNQQHIVLAFRGARNVSNFMTGVNVRLMPAYGGNVHQGFARAWATMRDAISTLLDRWQTDHRLLWLTGHSMGGALATLAAADFKGQGRPVREVVTFGAPRVGDAAFARGYQVPTIRFVNHHDPVPWVPPYLQHVGQQWHFLPDGRLVEKVSRWQLVLENALTFALNRNWPETLAQQMRQSLDNHLMETYLTRVQRAAQVEVGLHAHTPESR